MEQTVDGFMSLRRRVAPVDMLSGLSSVGGCFVLMPFRDHLRPVYDDHIVNVCHELGLTVTRADQIFSTRPVIDDILEAVASARVIVADLTQGNPNVFYEVGVCHTLGKTVILITQEDEVPFDLRHIRHIKYVYTPRGMRAMEESLKLTLQTVLLA